jgi:hypothetical protein
MLTAPNVTTPGASPAITRSQYLKVPPVRATLKRLAVALELEDGIPEWHEFLDLAAAEAGRIPEDLLSDEEIIALLPAVFRTFRSERAGDDRLEELIQILKRS